MWTFVGFIALVGYFGYNFFSLKKALDENLLMSELQVGLRFVFGAVIDLVKLIKK